MTRQCSCRTACSGSHRLIRSDRFESPDRQVWSVGGPAVGAALAGHAATPGHGAAPGAAVRPRSTSRP
ncbi:hypothetical protein ACFPM0_34575 [Pseudonocardia sulfidoxydans]|uniref:hypothetical protein n=1 Tax=Pseudonocardia sulfidoxydans TaxID=54011 RepID=UPI00361793E5